MSKREEMMVEYNKLHDRILSADLIELLTESAKSLDAAGYRLQPSALRLFAEKIERIRELQNDINILQEDQADGAATVPVGLMS